VHGDGRGGQAISVRALDQRGVGNANQQWLVTSLAQGVGEQEHLPLAAAPRSASVEME
jgi:hypothetical protein